MGLKFEGGPFFFPGFGRGKRSPSTRADGNSPVSAVTFRMSASVGQINGKVIQIELNYSDQSNLIRIKINVFLKVIRIELN